jgi:hypothetical protein
MPYYSIQHHVSHNRLVGSMLAYNAGDPGSISRMFFPFLNHHVCNGFEHHNVYFSKSKHLFTYFLSYFNHLSAPQQGSQYLDVL